MNEVVPTNWNQLNELLYEGGWSEPLQRFRPTVVYRGEGDAAADLSSTLDRLQAPEKVEDHLLRNFRKYARRGGAADESLWMWLALGQHHGLPTRLLDWTHSPQVALHFATADVNRMSDDGLIWCVDYTKTNKYLPKKLAKILDDEGSDLFTIEMLDGAAENLKHWDALAREGFVAFWEPPSLDDRMIHQFAVFSLPSKSCTSLQAWLSKRQECVHRIRIPSQLKWEIRDKLDQANVTERLLFPGLDGLCRWLKRYYSPRVDTP